MAAYLIASLKKVSDQAGFETYGGHKSAPRCDRTGAPSSPAGRTSMSRGTGNRR